jgi:hypothetical protein
MVTDVTDRTERPSPSIGGMAIRPLSALALTGSGRAGAWWGVWNEQSEDFRIAFGSIVGLSHCAIGENAANDMSAFIFEDCEGCQDQKLVVKRLGWRINRIVDIGSSRFEGRKKKSMKISKKILDPTATHSETDSERMLWLTKQQKYKETRRKNSRHKSSYLRREEYRKVRLKEGKM